MVCGRACYSLYGGDEFSQLQIVLLGSVDEAVEWGDGASHTMHSSVEKHTNSPRPKGHKVGQAHVDDIGRCHFLRSCSNTNVEGGAVGVLAP